MRRFVFENAGSGFQYVFDDDLGLSLQMSLSPRIGHSLQKIILSAHGLAGECRFRCAYPVGLSLHDTIKNLLLIAKSRIDNLIARVKKHQVLQPESEVGLIEFVLLDLRKPRLLEYSCLIDEILEGTICVSSEFYEQIYQAMHINTPDCNYRLNEYFGQKQGVWIDLEELTKNPSPFFDIQNPLDLTKFRDSLQASGHLEIESRVYLTLLTALLYSFDEQQELFAEQADLFISLQEHVAYAPLTNSLYDELAERIAERERERDAGNNPALPS